MPEQSVCDIVSHLTLIGHARCAMWLMAPAGGVVSAAGVHVIPSEARNPLRVDSILTRQGIPRWHSG